MSEPEEHTIHPQPPIPQSLLPCFACKKQIADHTQLEFALCLAFCSGMIESIHREVIREE